MQQTSTYQLSPARRHAPLPSLFKARNMRVRLLQVHRYKLSSASSNARAVTISAQQQLKDWLDIDQPLLWQGNEEQALSPYSPADQLPAPWKMLLLSDGSVTRHLQLLTGQPVTVDCLQMELLTGQQLHHPPGRALDIPGPLVQRQVLLRSTATSPVVVSEGRLSASSSGVPLVYAASWWSSDTVDQYLADKALPIWVSLSNGHMELYREIQLVECGHNPELERHFCCAGPFWGRQYYFWHNGKPLTLIHEVFSNSLQTYLGPLHARQSTSNGNGSGNDQCDSDAVGTG